MRLLLLLVLMPFSAFCFGQQVEPRYIEGHLQDENSKESLPFVRVYNKTVKIGTLTSETGYFKIAVLSLNDSIEIKAIGYQTSVIKLQENLSFYLVELLPNVKELSEVEFAAESDNYLFELLEKSSRFKKSSRTVKCYNMLSSFYDSIQVELVETYNNLNLNGYDIESLELKAGRLALQTFGDRYFTSQAGSAAIQQLKTFERNAYFPQTPLNLRMNQSKKRFRLEKSAAYRDEKFDSVYIINYRPKTTAEQNFQGKIWYNLTKSSIEKITMNCSQCETHPFLPLFPTDSIKNVDITITKTFAAEENDPLFSHIDFVYTIDYVSRPGKAEESRYSITTKSVLFAYDPDHSFKLPRFEFTTPTNDYRKINAFPYNSFFWKHNTEFGVNDQYNRNQLFFEDPKSITNSQFFKSSNSEWKTRNPNNKKQGYLEHPYIHWSTNRVFLREMVADSITKAKTGVERSLMYHLNVQTFLDVNTYNDSLHVLTETIFDPFSTYYYLPIDVYTNCFINMYFDLCELQRRRLEKELKNLTDPGSEQVFSLYDRFMSIAEKERELFLKEVERGTVQKAMEKWNELIRKEIGIDNISLFELEY